MKDNDLDRIAPDLRGYVQSLSNQDDVDDTTFSGGVGTSSISNPISISSDESVLSQSYSTYFLELVIVSFLITTL